MLKKVVSILSVTSTLALVSPVFAADLSSNQSSTTSVSESTPASPINLIKQRINYENSNQVENIGSLFVDSEQGIYKSFFSNPLNKENHLGLYDIESASLVSYKELSAESVRTFIDVNKYKEQYGEVHFYYIAESYKVYSENKYFLDGTNYYLAAIVKENGQWKFAEYSVAPVDSFVKMNIGFGTSDESGMAKIMGERYNGVYKNRNNQVLQINTGKDSTSNSTTKNSTITPDTTFTRPSTISVYITSSTNESYYLSLATFISKC